MKKALTLIELIFTIIIMGVLASVAIPKFKNLTFHAKTSSVKSLVTSVQSSIDNIHGKWIINEDYKWIGADGVDHSADFDDTLGYPKVIDDGKDTTKLFSYVLKIPVPSCGTKTQGCWKEYDDNKYEYFYTSTKILKINYNPSTGMLECIDGDNITQSECERIIY